MPSNIASVARYLNGLYYHFPATNTKQTGQFDGTRRVAALRQD